MHLQHRVSGQIVLSGECFRKEFQIIALSYLDYVVLSFVVYAQLEQELVPHRLLNALLDKLRLAKRVLHSKVLC
jgi:hypothetical protein